MSALAQVLSVAGASLRLALIVAVLLIIVVIVVTGLDKEDE